MLPQRQLPLIFAVLFSVRIFLRQYCEENLENPDRVQSLLRTLLSSRHDENFRPGQFEKRRSGMLHRVVQARRIPALNEIHPIPRCPGEFSSRDSEIDHAAIINQILQIGLRGLGKFDITGPGFQIAPDVVDVHDSLLTLRP